MFYSYYIVPIYQGCTKRIYNYQNSSSQNLLVDEGFDNLLLAFLRELDKLEEVVESLASSVQLENEELEVICD